MSSIFANSAFFNDLSPMDVQSLSSKSVTRMYPAKSLLINEGEASDTLYVILQGRVRVFVSDEEGREVTLNIQGSGEYFGELSLLDQEPRSASVVTLEKSRIAMIPKQDFQHWILDQPDISLRLMCALSRRIRALTANLKSMALMNVYSRLAHLLGQMAEYQDGQWVVDQRLTQQDIASMVGSSREMVSRVMKELTKGGYIELKDKKIIFKKRLPGSW